MVSTSLDARLAAIAADLKIDSETEFHFAGNLFDVHQSPWSLPAQPPVTPRQRLVHAVALALYYGAYCRDPAKPLILLPQELEPDPDFVARLSEANQTTGTVEHGWQLIQRDPDGTIHVTKSGRFRIASIGQYCQADANLRDSSLYSLPVVREQRDWMPMFYFAHSESLPNQCDDLDNVRFYFHCDEDSVVDVVHAVTSRLNQYSVPFRLKCLNHRRLYGRTDTAVLYVEKRYADFVSRCLSVLAGDGSFRLAESVPLFTKRLVGGIGIAEDPGNGQSFGQQRTRFLAEALIAAHEANCLHDDRVIEFIASRFRQSGVDLAHPHLNAGSVDWYAR